MIQIEQFIAELHKSISLFMPETALLITFILALLFDVIFKKIKNISAYIALLGFIVTAILLSCNYSTQFSAFSKLLVIDPFAVFFKYIILLSSFLVILISFFSKELYTESKSVGEYYSLIVGMTFGMFLLAGSSNMLMIYLSIEIMSLSSYVLAGYTKEIKRASEASLKYVIFGAVSSGLMIYGISILYGLTGHLNLSDINLFLSQNEVAVVPLLIASLMIVAGIGYKISVVPFHFWTPDVYEGAPITITAYLSVASKAAGFAVLIRFLKTGFVSYIPSEGSAWILLNSIDWSYVIAVLSVITMTLGNLVAIWQTNLKRLLAYSSIAHAGYILMGVVVLNDIGVASVLIYFVMYLFMNLGAFFVIMLLANKIGSEELSDYTGIGYRAPILGVCMVLFLISLTGLPPTAGFIGKLYVFSAVLNAGDKWMWLLVAGILNSVVSLYYYVKIFRNMFVKGLDQSGKEQFEFHPLSYVILFLLAIPTLLFGVYFSPIVDWANKSDRKSVV